MAGELTDWQAGHIPKHSDRTQLVHALGQLPWVRGLGVVRRDFGLVAIVFGPVILAWASDFQIRGPGRVQSVST